ncbi:MAG: sensor histidine kinase [Clostridia bacterium]|nr:sensor histidine kinase [Clostridia bacterium]
MKKAWNRSFRWKLLTGFLVIGLVPLLLCTVLMLAVFQMTLQKDVRSTADAALASMDADFDSLVRSAEEVMALLRGDSVVKAALSGSRTAGPQDVYYALYTQSSPLLNRADFSIFDVFGRRVYSTAGGNRQRELPTQWGLLEAARENDEIVVRSVETFGAGETDERFNAACTIRRGRTMLGYVVMEMTDAHFEKLFDGKFGATDSIVVLDPYWSQIYSSHPAQNEGLADQLRTRVLAGAPLSGENDEFSYYVRENPSTGFFLLLRQPKPLSAGTMRLLSLIAGATVVICVLLCAAWAVGLSRQLFRPIQVLNDAMGEVEEGNLTVRVEHAGTDEIGQLAGHFDRMVEKLQGYIADSLHKQKELNDARVRMMQAQLNPHFLYNTLDTMKWMGKIHQIPEVATISANLADLLRASISGTEFVPLEDELKILDRYVEIQKIRFSGKFEYRTQVDAAALDALVPKLMLQPLVENAIVHGLDGSEGGEIFVAAHVDGGELTVTVKDDGCGMTEESIRRFRAQTAPMEGHLGLYNVDAILRLNFGEDCGLRFVPADGRGTCIRIVIPVRREVRDAQGSSG